MRERADCAASMPGPCCVQTIDPPASFRRRRLARLFPLAGAALALAAALHAEAPAASTSELAMQVNADKLTLAVAKVPQVYLYGTIDAGAPERFDALLRSGKVPRGSDVYLNATGSDLQAGMALGRLFRANMITTHLGVPRRPSRSPAAPREASCLDACTLAYLGGFYRWAPTGNDRFGMLPSDPAPSPANGVKSYLKDMDIHPDWLRPVAPQSGLLTNEDLVNSGFANNGLQLPTAGYYQMGGAPYLIMDQATRDGQRRITLLCRPDGLTLTGYYMVGIERARKILARATGSSIEVDRQPAATGDRDSISTTSDSVVVTRTVPFAQLAQVVAAKSMGIWLNDRGGALRYGFDMEMAALRNALRNYGESCTQSARSGKR